MIVRRERPHPGAQLTLIEQRDGWRYTALATDTRVGQLALPRRPPPRPRPRRGPHPLRQRHRPGPLPVRASRSTPAWLTAVMIAVDLLAWTQTLLLHDTPLARAEPKTLRYRLLHVAARLTRGQRRRWLRIDQHWPWAGQLAAAFARLPRYPSRPVEPARHPTSSRSTRQNSKPATSSRQNDTNTTTRSTDQIEDHQLTL